MNVNAARLTCDSRVTVNNNLARDWEQRVRLHGRYSNQRMPPVHLRHRAIWLSQSGQLTCAERPDRNGHEGHDSVLEKGFRS